MFQKHVCPPHGAKFRFIFSVEAKPVRSKGLKYTKRTLGTREWFDLDLCTFDLKINRYHLHIEGKFEIDQRKGSKDIEQTQ